jgi:hypothetical protein
MWATVLAYLIMFMGFNHVRRGALGRYEFIVRKTALP